MIIKAINKILQVIGYEINSIEARILNDNNKIIDMLEDKDFINIYEKVKPYTMTSIERLYSLYRSVNYVLDNDIKGDFVECGVWKGGSSILMGIILESRQIKDRRIIMYDTFDGMSDPTESDVSVDGQSANNKLSNEEKNDNSLNWAFCTKIQVEQNILNSKLDLNLFNLVEGKVEDTIPSFLPNDIAILRLDTDWYESTRHELIYLFPLLCSKGILIIDDYGHWQGAKRAVDEYFTNSSEIFLHRIDYTGRLVIKNQ